jgi:hypothetical protein
VNSSRRDCIDEEIATRPGFTRADGHPHT